MRRSIYYLLPLLAAWSPAHAQVIDIDADGHSTIYDRPMLFTAAEPVPIAPESDTLAPVLPSAILIASAASAQKLAPGLLEAVAWQESRGRMNAVSPKGALGVMQLMPATAAALGVNPYKLDENIHGGALYLRRQIDRFGSIPLALAAYNAGPEAVARFGGIPPFRETRAYVAAVLAHWRPAAEAAPVNMLLVEEPSS